MAAALWAQPEGLALRNGSAAPSQRPSSSAASHSHLGPRWRAQQASGAGAAPPHPVERRRRRRRQRHGSTPAAVAGSSSYAQASSQDEEAWEATYGQPVLRYGTSLEQGVRETMEDAAQLVPAGRCGFFFATVFDGHGGFAAAEYLQQNLYRIFTRVLDQRDAEADLRMSVDVSGLACPTHLTPILTDSFHHADKDLLAWMHANAPEEERTSGCTATTCLVRKDLVVVANVGDSRAVLSRAGRAIDLSTEHRVWGKSATVLAEIERIESVGGWVDDGRVCGVLAVSRAFGDMEFKGQEGLKMLLQKGLEFGLWDQKFADSRRFTGDPVTAQPDVTELALHEGDEFVVVASDGLWDVMDSQEVVKLARRDLQRGSHPQEVAAKLSALAVKRGSQDNVAVVLIDLGKVDWSKQSNGGGGLFGSLGGLFGSRG
ncbi:hypothetical protein ABPG75_013131 [Micractinium tetrahymenae]